MVAVHISRGQQKLNGSEYFPSVHLEQPAISTSQLSFALVSYVCILKKQNEQKLYTHYITDIIYEH